MPKSIFRNFNFNEFNNYLRQTVFQRRVTVIQNHHTWKPNYSHFNWQDPKHMTLLENMRRDHIQNRGWSDIGQNITIFPDGKISLCRSIDITPAGIFGANTGAICIENIGNFDEGGDTMTNEQRDAIVKTNAALCVKFGLKPLSHQVVYHHWYNTKGKRFTSAEIDSGKVQRNGLQKSCPGTNFFFAPGSPKGNTIQCASDNFYPLIRAEMNSLQQTPAPTMQPEFKRVSVTTLNVRSGPSMNFSVIGKISKGIQIQVFDIEEGWSRISSNAEEWVSSGFLA